MPIFTTKLIEEQKALENLFKKFNKKPKKVLGLAKVIEQQKKFIEQVNLTLDFLKIYQGNPEEFALLIGDDVWEFYRFGECVEHPEFMWECIDELTCDIVYGNKNFKFTGNGIFTVLHFSKTKNKKFKEYLEYFKKLGEKEWAI